MILNPTATRRALLVWQRPLDQTGRRDRHAVAELLQLNDRVSFHYFSDEQLAEAREAGFVGYPGLPSDRSDLDRVAVDVLMRRLPPKERGDFGSLLERFGLPPEREYSDLSLLAYTGARLTSDSFSVCETFDGFELPFTYIFDVAGNRHYPSYQQLAINEPLRFNREPENLADPNAIRISRVDGTTVGYVNRLQANSVGNWLDEGQITATVFRINGRPEYPRLFVRAEIAPASHSLAA